MEELVGRQYGPLTIATRTIRYRGTSLEVEVDCSLCGKRGWRSFSKISRRTPRGCEHCMAKYGAEYPEWLAQRVNQQRLRCQCPQHHAYKTYGGRGIEFRFSSVTEGVRWIVANLGLPPNRSWTIDRIDNNGHYESGNLRWATMLTQARNQDTAWRARFHETYPFVTYCGTQLMNLRRRGLTPKQIADRWLSRYGTSDWADTQASKDKLKQNYPFVAYSRRHLARLIHSGMTPEQISAQWLLKYGTSEMQAHATVTVPTD